MDVDKLFGRIACRYDVFNRIASLGLDKCWRRKLAQLLKEQKNLKVLDIAVGTGDILLSLFENSCDINFAAGIDISTEMLAVTEKKLSSLNVELKHAKAEAIPYPENKFDAVTCAFGVRNFSDVDLSLKEMYRVLKPAGKLFILEFSLPQNVLIKFFYLLYLKFYIPLLGKIITGDLAAYKYLSRTIQSFPSGANFCQCIRKAGFTDVKAIPLTFGIVTLYYTIKSAQ